MYAMSDWQHPPLLCLGRGSQGKRAWNFIGCTWMGFGLKSKDGSLLLHVGLAVPIAFLVSVCLSRFTIHVYLCSSARLGFAQRWRGPLFGCVCVCVADSLQA